jgi:SH3 domain protein
MMRQSAKMLVAVIMLALAGSATAETTRWVADDLKVAVRSGPSTKHRILRFIESGTPMAVLAQDEAAGYSQVRAPDGTEGWMLTEQLMDRRGARERLERAEARIESLQAARQEANATMAELRAQIDQLAAEKTALEGQVAGLQQELGDLRRVAAEPIAVAQDNEALRKALAEEQLKVKTLGNEVISLRDRSLKEWFMIGAGVSIGSLFLGLIIPRIRWRRRGWDDFR